MWCVNWQCQERKRSRKFNCKSFFKFHFLPANFVKLSGLLAKFPFSLSSYQSFEIELIVGKSFIFTAPYNKFLCHGPAAYSLALTDEVHWLGTDEFRVNHKYNNQIHYDDFFSERKTTTLNFDYFFFLLHSRLWVSQPSPMRGTAWFSCLYMHNIYHSRCV